jgi:hypothetical protein
MDYVAWIAIRHCKGVRMPLVISGDTHHYSRYEGDESRRMSGYGMAACGAQRPFVATTDKTIARPYRFAIKTGIGSKRPTAGSDSKGCARFGFA